MKTRHPSSGDTLELVRSDYLEIPGLHLTQRQIERFWGIDAHTAETLLRALVTVGFLRRTRNHAYVRATNNEEARHRPAACRRSRRQPKRADRAA